VDSVSRLSELAGISRSFLGATLVSLGTTLPELSVSLSAARKKEYSLSFGNAVGSTIVNLTAVLGTAIVIDPIVILAPSTFLVTLLFAVFANIVLLYIALRVKKLGKLSGAILLAFYLSFLICLYIIEKQNGLLPIS